MITAMLASILPARKALKLKPSEAVRQDVLKDKCMLNLKSL